jgi:hypothetical protein
VSSYNSRSGGESALRIPWPKLTVVQLLPKMMAVDSGGPQRDPQQIRRGSSGSERVFEKSRFCNISPTMFPLSSFQKGLVIQRQSLASRRAVTIWSRLCRAESLRFCVRIVRRFAICYPEYLARNTFFCTFPIALRGSSLTK